LALAEWRVNRWEKTEKGEKKLKSGDQGGKRNYGRRQTSGCRIGEDKAICGPRKLTGRLTQKGRCSMQQSYCAL